MNAEIETFCERQILPRRTRHSLLLLVEELLQIYQPYLNSTPLDLTLSYSEKTANLELVCESGGEAMNPFDTGLLPDELGLNIITNLTKHIEYRRMDQKNRVTLSMTQMP